MIQTYISTKHEREDKSTDVNNHFCLPHLVRYGWGHYTDSDQDKSGGESRESIKRTVLGSSQVHPLNISDTDLEQDRAGQDGHESSSSDAQDGDDVRIEIIAPQLEKPPDPDTSSMTNTLCDSPHRFKDI